MTPGNNGASTPEDDDPFGYLYADGQANGAQPPSGGGYGYPGSVNRVRPVGERQYGGQQAAAAPTAQYQQPYGQTVPQQQSYGAQPNAHYQAPETFPGGPPAGQQPPAYNHSGGNGGRGRGPNTKGLLIGAIAVVAAVVIGISVAMMNGSDDNKTNDQAGSTPSASQSASSSPSASSSASSGLETQTIDAKALNLQGGATLASDVEGADAAGGVYVTGLNTVGASVSWQVNGIPSDGTYTVFAHYSSTSDDQQMTLSVNGKKFGSPFSLKNYAKAADGDFAKGWTTSFVWPSLTKGSNTLTLSCENGDNCNVLLDQLWVKQGQVKK
ncbi:carbohydrate-binding protein [Streptomyces sp. NPDC096013]|uniref:carbohydrate-binding protein n=1 Tax=Streptomyces sp. NPDC096013 TaxID=3366069 RepID=UPI003810FBF5